MCLMRQYWLPWSLLNLRKDADAFCSKSPRARLHTSSKSRLRVSKMFLAQAHSSVKYLISDWLNLNTYLVCWTWFLRLIFNFCYGVMPFKWSDVNVDFGKENPNFMGNITEPSVLNSQIPSALGEGLFTLCSGILTLFYRWRCSVRFGF